MREKRLKTIGAISLVVGILLFANVLGYLKLQVSPFATAQTTRGTASISASSTFGTPQTGILLSTVMPGNTYKWKVTVKNTGNVDWDNAWYTIRLSKSRNNPDISDLGTRRVKEPTVAGGKTLVLEGNYKGSHTYNDINLRDQIKGEWKINVPQEDVNNRVASVMIGGLDQGESKTVEFTMSVPENLKYKGERILVGNAVAYVGGNYVVDSNQDTVSMGNLVVFPRSSSLVPQQCHCSELHL